MNGIKECSKLDSHLYSLVDTRNVAMRIMSLQKSFFIGLQPLCLGRSIALQGVTSMHSCSPWLRLPSVFGLLAASMALHVLQFQNRKVRVQKLTSELFVFPSCFSFYTQMNSYCNTQMEVFLP